MDAPPDLPHNRYFKDPETGALSSFGSSEPISDDNPNITNHLARGLIEITRDEHDRAVAEQEAYAEAEKQRWIAEARAEALKPVSPVAPPADPVADARAALSRAYEHLESLESEVAKHKRLDNYRVEVQPYGDGPFRVALGEHVEAHFVLKRLTRETTPPATVGDDLPRRAKAIFGDLVMNARNALDYLVYGLSVSPNASDAKGARKWKSKVAFPIFADDPFMKGDGLWVTRLRGVPKAARDLIEAEQPYVTSEEPDEHPLAILSKAVNTHKHAQMLKATIVDGSPFGGLPGDEPFPLVPTVVKRTVTYDESGIYRGASLGMSTLPSFESIYGQAVNERKAGSAGFVVTRGIGYVEFKAEVHAPLQILVEDANGRDILEASRDILACVGKIVRTFAERWDEISAEEPTE